MENISPQELTIYKFEPNNIIMMHKATKHLYQYFQTPIKSQKSANVFHEHLLKAAFLPTGIIYRKGITTMQNEISTRMKSSLKQSYEQQQLINTFLPILSCINHLHSQNIVHGSICPQNIVFNEDGDVLLRDWNLQIVSNKYYQPQSNMKQRTRSDDLCALGRIIYEASTMMEFVSQSKAHLNFDNPFRKLVQKYSRGYILGVYIMIKKIQKFYSHLETILKNNSHYIDSSEQLVTMFKNIKGEKQRKANISPILNFNNFKLLDSMAKQTNTKKSFKNQDVQNKRIFDDPRRKNIDRVSRIIDKNTNNEVINKVDMVLKKMNNLRISNLQETDSNSQKTTNKEEILKFDTPLKRLKTFSKRKAF